MLGYTISRSIGWTEHSEVYKIRKKWQTDAFVMFLLDTMKNKKVGWGK